MIPYKDYVACRAAEVKPVTATRSTLEDKENRDEETPLPPRETPPGMRPKLPSQEDEWKLIINQDPCLGSVAGDSGHGTMVTTSETEPVNSNEELIGAVGGINENVSTGIDENISAGYFSDVEWKEEDLLIEINDENVTIAQVPAAALTPVQASTGKEVLSPMESPIGKKPCFDTVRQESTVVHLLKAAPPLCLEPDYIDA